MLEKPAMTSRSTRNPHPLARRGELTPRNARLALAIALLPFAVPAFAQTTTTVGETEVELAPQVVTASPMQAPLTVVADPQEARQPMPAHDGADILKTIPGFNVIRKGGTDGDPVFRGMAGSRVNILLDGEHIMGGCGGRMDPPTAYIFPEAYDRITILKGPQSVQYGPGASAATVLFERERERAVDTTTSLRGSLTLGSFGRNDQVLDANHATPQFYVRGTATRSQADDYEDGDGRKVHSEYLRWSANAALGWTPDDDTLVELNLARSDGEAAYADRSMDGTLFDRENIGLKFERRNLSPLVASLSAQLYRNYVDHVMDNYSLRRQPGMKMLNNPDRLTRGGRIVAGLSLGEATHVDLGADLQYNDHSLRNGVDYRDKPRMDDAEFRNAGLFAEMRHALGDDRRIVAGLRVDRWRAKDERSPATLVGGSPVASAGESRSDTLTSGFARWEQDIADGTTVYAGLGHSARFPDYWELISASKQSLTSNTAFGTRPEKTTQLDVGLTHRAGPWQNELALFAARIDDFILTDTATRPGATIVRNVDARTWGLEAGSGYRFNPNWRADAALAWVYGQNRSDDTALAQIAPLDARFALEWRSGAWTAGALLRLVAAQDRVDPGRGNIVGQDIGKSPGFGVFSVNGGYRVNKSIKLTAGIDNLFDKRYAEHISRAGAMVAGFEQTSRVNEPGRNVWLKAEFALD